MKLRSVSIVLAFAGLLCQVPMALGQREKTKDQVVPQSPLPAYFGPKKRARVEAIEVKVQAVATSVPTPSGSTSVVSLDLLQPTEFGTGLSEMLMTALVESNRFIVIEQRPAATGDEAQGEDAPRPLPAQVVIRGAITELSFKRSGLGGNLVSEIVDGSVIKSVASVALDLRIVDAETGQVLESVRAQGSVGSQMSSLNLKQEDFKIGVASFDNGPLGRAVRSAINDAVKKICERTQQLPWQARIAEAAEGDEGPELYINAGTESGLKVGDILEIWRQGKPIRDPDSGLILGHAKGTRLGICRLSKIEPKFAIAVPTEGSGFVSGDVVRFVRRP